MTQSGQNRWFASFWQCDDVADTRRRARADAALVKGSSRVANWRHVATELDKAAAGADVADVAAVLRMVPMLETVDCWPR